MKHKIGTVGTGYVTERNLTSLPFEHFQIVQEHDLFNLLTFLRRLVSDGPNATALINCLHCDAGINRVPLLHLINAISCSRTPWVVSYSHYLPRWNVRSRFGMKQLASETCKKIIAISHFAYDQQRHFLKEFPEYEDAIQKKMCIVHPAQESLIGDVAAKKTDVSVITFTIAGSDFFRKGGTEILLTFDRLIREGYPVKLNVISTLDDSDYASGATKVDQRFARMLISKHKNTIHHFERLSNSQVLDVFLRSDVGLLPTYDDIYGYSVLEAQAAGCPVISTDVCALPEINNDDVGWLIEVPKDEFGIAHRYTSADRKRLSDVIVEGLYETIKEMAADRSLVAGKGARALERIKRECTPLDRVRKLEEIYTEILGQE